MVVRMSKGIVTTICVFAIVILIVIAGFFLLGIEKIAINYWAFGSLLFSLFVSLGATVTLVARKNNKEGVFYAAGLSSAILIYEIAVVITVLLARLFTNRVNSFVFIQIAINALFFITAIVIVNVSGRIHDNNVKTYENLQTGEYDRPKRGGF